MRQPSQSHYRTVLMMPQVEMPHLPSVDIKTRIKNFSVGLSAYMGFGTWKIKATTIIMK
jgi:hypothetical protein